MGPPLSVTRDCKEVGFTSTRWWVWYSCLECLQGASEGGNSYSWGEHHGRVRGYHVTSCEDDHVLAPIALFHILDPSHVHAPAPSHPCPCLQQKQSKVSINLLNQAHQKQEFISMCTLRAGWADYDNVQHLFWKELHYAWYLKVMQSIKLLPPAPVQIRHPKIQFLEFALAGEAPSLVEYFGDKKIALFNGVWWMGSPKSIGECLF